MADLLPSMASDDEEYAVVADDENDSSADEKDEMDGSFEFGGILGEDGGMSFATATKNGWDFQSAMKSLEKSTTAPARMDVASLIAAKRKALKQEKHKPQEANEEEDKTEDESESESDPENIDSNKDDKDNNSSSSDDDSSSGSDSSDSEDDEVDDNDVAKKMEQDVLKIRNGSDKKKKKASEDENDNQGEDESIASDDDDDDDEEDAEEAKKAAKYFDLQDSSVGGNPIELFVQLTLSRPLLRGVAAMGFVKPTPIQAACIPVALQGRDICASAVTGSGKTAAFSLPILERLLHRAAGSSRALILTPTRELAAQCLGMITSLAQFTHLRASLIVGGSKNLTSQAAELRTRPDIIVATPGRLLDHVTNSAGVDISELEFLVLDEADRLLDLGFQDEVFEIVKSCPVQRQTLLFSATMNTKVDDLIKLSLKRPVRIRVSNKNPAFGTASSNPKDLEVAPHLEQEFIRIRAGNEGLNREAILLALLTRTFTTQTIVFFDTKAIAHRIMILCGLCGITCAELHGNLSQPQRLAALESFRKGDVNVLLATDLAGRGIDIPNVETVINFEMPSQVATYIHRIGRTARAGRGGRSCTLIGEGRRHLMKTVMKDAAEKKKIAGKSKFEGGSRFQSGAIRSRSVPAAVVAHFFTKIKSLEPHVKEVLQAEAVARLDRLADMEATKAQNLIEHADEINSRPQREWFASSKQKQLTKDALARKQEEIRAKIGTGTHRMTRKKRRAREALEALKQSEEIESDDEAGRINAKKSKIDPEQIIKSAAKAAKRKEQQKDRERAAASISDGVPMASKKKKVKAGSDAVGDSSLFEEEKVAHSKKASKTEEERRAKGSFHFRDADFDPNKKKGKKKSVNSFKSKSKYKRRKR